MPSNINPIPFIIHGFRDPPNRIGHLEYYRLNIGMP